MNIEQLMPKQSLTAALEIIINKALSLDEQYLRSFQAIDGTSISIVLSELGFALSFYARDGQISVLADDLSTDCVIETSIKTLPKLTQSKLLTSLIKSGELNIEGDPKIAQKYSALGEKLSIDWEQQLANKIGQVPTHKLLSMVNVIKQKLQFAEQQVSQDASEYLLHEKRLLVTKNQVTDFTLAVAVVEQQAQALEQRLKKLSLTISNNTTSKG